MKKSKAIQTIVFFLVLSFLGWSLPKVCLEDINQDKSVDLEDAILAATGFATSAENPTIFKGSLGNLVSTLQTVAKLKPQAISDNDHHKVPGTEFGDLFVLCSNSLIVFDFHWTYEELRMADFSSRCIAPEPYPPKISLFST